MKKPIALVDMDGTVADFQGAMRRDLDKLRSPYEPVNYGMDENDRPEYLKERWDIVKRQPDWWFNLEPLPSGFLVVNHLRSLGFKIHVLTRAPKKLPAAWEQKVRWCMKHLPGDAVTITPDKHLVYGKVLVDDWPEYIEPWLKVRPRGLVIMPAQEWNAELKHPQIVRHVYGENDQEVMDALTKHYETIKTESKAKK